MKRLRGALAAVLALTLALGVGLAVRRFGLGLARVTGSSMSDTLMAGDIVLVTRFDYLRGRKPVRGDVVECRFPGRADTYIKRVVGLPGEEIVFSGGGLTINGQPEIERCVSSPTDDYAILLGEDQYLALGDNRAESYDSRMPDMGPLDANAFLGRVRCVLWPLNRFGGVD